MRKGLLVLSVIALLTVIAGYSTAPQPDEGALAHVFQLSIVAIAPVLVIFLVTTDWRRPLAAARELTIPGSALAVAFVALYFLEHR